MVVVVAAPLLYSLLWQWAKRGFGRGWTAESEVGQNIRVGGFSRRSGVCLVSEGEWSRHEMKPNSTKARDHQAHQEVWSSVVGIGAKQERHQSENRCFPSLQMYLPTVQQVQYST